MSRKKTNKIPPRLSPKQMSAKVRADAKAQRDKIQQRIKAQNEKTRLGFKEQKRIIRLTASKVHKGVKLFTSKTFIYATLLLVQIVLIPVALSILNPFINSTVFLIVAKVAGLIFAVVVINRKMPNEFKIVWVMIIMLFTVLGIFLYLSLGNKKISRRKDKKYCQRASTIFTYTEQNAEILQRAIDEDAFIGNLAGIVKSGCNLPLEFADECEYIEIGEKYFERVKTELAAAEKFIFIESFIISEGSLWNELFEILKQKSKNGLDVRIIYDDLGSMSTIPHKFGKTCIDSGIKLYCFNRLRPLLDVAQNNRTHRKMIVIDGKCVFTGGLNIGDEYVNRTIKHGHWKDTGVMLKGGAVKSFTLMFLSSWLRYFGNEDIAPFMPDTEVARNENSIFCIPFSDSPLSRRTVCEDVYLKIINNAKHYVYINTPYFIVDDKMTSALITAAESGVDVRITVPHIPDKKIILAMTRAFYTPLVQAGVKIYEYKPGFIHAKSIVSDDKYSVVGSSNMDFRSLYLHYECDVFVYKAIAESMYNDYIETCEKSILITSQEVSAVPFYKRILRSFLRIFSPLM